MQPDHTKSYFASLPLRMILIIPVVTLLLVTIGLIGYFSYVSGQKAVNAVAQQLRLRIANQIEQQLEELLSTPHRIDISNGWLIQNGMLDSTSIPQMQAIFLAQVRNNPSISSIYFGSPQGGIVGAGREGPHGSLYVYQTPDLQPGTFEKFQSDEQGNPGKQVARVENFDASTRQWYKKAIEARGPIWSDIYILITGQEMAMAASMPVYDQQNTLMGVISIDLFLSQINNYLHSIEISPNGQCFIVEKNGLLVASSSSTPLLTPDGENGSLTRILAEDSPAPLIRQTARHIRSAYGGFSALPQIDQHFQFQQDGASNHVLIHPLAAEPGLDWYIVVVIPADDYMEPVKSNNWYSFAAILAATLIAILLYILIARRLSGSLETFTQSARSAASGAWDQVIVPSSRIRELNILTEAFNHMHTRLRQSLEDLTSENQERKLVEESLRASREDYARLYGEAQRRADELAALNRIGRAIVSNLELDQILKTLYEECQAVLPISIFYVAIYDEKKHTIYHPLFIDNGKHITFDPVDILVSPGLSGTVILSKQTLYLSDLSDPAISGQYPLIRVSESEVLSYVGVPLIARDRALGVISMQSPLDHAYQPEQIRLLEIIADQAATAIDNSQMYSEMRDNTLFLEALNATTRSALEAEDFLTMLQTLADQVTLLFQSDGCYITRWDDERQLAYPAAASNDQTAAYLQDIPEPGEVTLTRSVLELEKSLAVTDTLNSPHLSPIIAARHQSRSLLGLPLIVGTHKLGAVLIAYNQTHEFSAEEITLGELAATQIALTIAKAELVATDYLTHVYNRRGLIDLGLRAISYVRRYGESLSAILFDIDHFKKINDDYGHEVGDQVLKSVAQMARQKVRLSDLIGRYGGEEFVILLPRTSLEAAHQLADRLCQSIGTTPIPTSKGDVSITVSIGVATLRDHTSDIDTLIRAADDAMYSAKRAGRNRAVVSEM